jgi:16S rRNA (uracil1498-N3)-methyltransferase
MSGHGLDGSKHEFALYAPDLGSFLIARGHGDSVVIKDPTLIHRIGTVLRLEVGESVLLFDQKLHAQCTLQVVNKKEVTCIVAEKQENCVLQPAVTFFLPVLKKEDLEIALYSLVELGATTVQLVTTTKSRHLGQKEREEKELERLERIIIAAAEQSKQFSFPCLQAPISFDQMLAYIQKKTQATALFFDPAGQSLFSIMKELHAAKPTEVIALVGPEGDLTDQEKASLEQAHVRFCKLTPTVLRSVQVVAVGMGVIRSVV